MLKVELHTHTADDPVDTIPHSAQDLIDRAAVLGYGALAITLHERQFESQHITAYARDRGIVLIRGIERTIDGRHVLLLNFTQAVEDLRTFEDLARLRRRERGLVVAPHPFFPSPVALRGALERHAELFDAVELNAMVVRGIDFNRRAEVWAALHGKPVVGNGDVHRLVQLGSTYSLVDVPPASDADSICEAIRVGRVRVEHRQLSWATAARVMASIALDQVLARAPWSVRTAQRR